MRASLTAHRFYCTLKLWTRILLAGGIGWRQACFSLAMLVAAGRLFATNWVPHLDYVEVLVALGVILGLALGKSFFSRRVAIWLAIGYTLFFIPWQLAHATEGAISWGERLVSLGGRLIFSAGATYQPPAGGRFYSISHLCLHPILDHQRIQRLCAHPDMAISWQQFYRAD